MISFFKARLLPTMAYPLLILGMVMLLSPGTTYAQTDYPEPELDCEIGDCPFSAWSPRSQELTIPAFPGCILTVEYESRQCGPVKQFRNWQIVGSRQKPADDPLQAPRICTFDLFFLNLNSGDLFGDPSDDERDLEFITKLKEIELQITRIIIDRFWADLLSASIDDGTIGGLSCNNPVPALTASFLRGSCLAGCTGFRVESDGTVDITRNVPCGPSCCPLTVTYCVDGEGNTQRDEFRDLDGEKQFCEDIYGLTPASITLCPDLPNVTWEQIGPCFPLCGDLDIEGRQQMSMSELEELTDASGANSWQVFPNPSDDTWNLSSNNQQITSYRLVDLLGKTIIQTDNIKESDLRIDGSQLSKGVYMLNFTTADGKQHTTQLLKN